MTLVHISTVTVGAGGAASIEFTGIPQTGTDLLVVVSGQVLSGGMNIDLRFNNNSSTIYSKRWLGGSGSSVASYSQTAQNRFILQATGSASSWGTFSNATIYIPNYSGSTNKSISVDAVNEQNATSVIMELQAGLFGSTSAITSIQLIGDGGNLIAQYSTASLYTITKGSGGATVS